MLPKQIVLRPDPKLVALIVRESEKMFMSPAKWLEFVAINHLNNQKTFLTNAKSKQSKPKRVWPGVSAPVHTSTKLTHNSPWRYNGELIWATNPQGHRYMARDDDANGQAFARGLWYYFIEPLLSEGGIVVAEDSDNVDWPRIAELVADYLKPDSVSLLSLDPTSEQNFIEAFTNLIASGDILEYVELDEGCTPKHYDREQT